MAIQDGRVHAGDFRGNSIEQQGKARQGVFLDNAVSCEDEAAYTKLRRPLPSSNPRGPSRLSSHLRNEGTFCQTFMREGFLKMSCSERFFGRELDQSRVQYYAHRNSKDRRGSPQCPMQLSPSESYSYLYIRAIKIKGYRQVLGEQSCRSPT